MSNDVRCYQCANFRPGDRQNLEDVLLDLDGLETQVTKSRKALRLSDAVDLILISQH